jgi:hypothetical protein
MGGPKGINWEAALEFYLTPDSEGDIPSYQDVANKFGVSKKEVGLRAKRESWLQRRQNVYDLAESAFAENKVELIKQTIQRHIELWQRVQGQIDKLLDLLEKTISENGLDRSNLRNLLLIAKTLKIAIDGERLSLGLPNTVSSSNIQIEKDKICLTPESVAEIDRLFEINISQINNN